MGRLSGKTALVTGAGRGIGRGIARRLAADGAKVAINYARSAEQAEGLAKEITAAGGEALTVKADITSTAEIDAMFAELKGKLGTLDILVNNAGRGSGGNPMLDSVTPGDFDAIFALNARGTFFVTQGAVRMMNDGGRIINISSTSTRVRAPGLSAYAASKITVEAFTRIWSAELAPRGIRVNSVLPGIVDTDLISHMPPERKARSVASVPLGRLGQPEDIADVVAFLASDDARWVTGHEIVASGGN